VQISITERHVATDEQVKEYAREKAGKLTRYYDRITAIDIILDGAQGQESVEMIVHAAGSDRMVGHETSGDFFAGIDLVVDRLERQLTRHKEKHRNRKHMAKKPPIE
jgi:putative sigma-54 modulation protein